MDNINKLFAEDSTLIFTEGDQIKGANEVEGYIWNCCRSYNDGYKHHEKQQLALGFGIGLVGIITYQGIKHIIKRIKKSKKKTLKEEA